MRELRIGLMVVSLWQAEAGVDLLVSWCPAEALRMERGLDCDRNEGALWRLMIWREKWSTDAPFKNAGKFTSFPHGATVAAKYDPETKNYFVDYASLRLTAECDSGTCQVVRHFIRPGELEYESEEGFILGNSGGCKNSIMEGAKRLLERYPPEARQKVQADLEEKPEVLSPLVIAHYAEERVAKEEGASDSQLQRVCPAEDEVTKKLKALIPDATDVVNNGLRRRRQSKRKRRSRDLDDGASPTVSPSRAGTGTTVLHHGLMVDQFLRDEEDDDDHHPAERGSPREEEEELVTRPASPLLPPAVDPRPVPSGEQGNARECKKLKKRGERPGQWESPSEGVTARVEEKPITRARASGEEPVRREGHRRHHSRQPEQRSRSPRDGGSSSRHRSSSHGRRSFGRHAEGDVNVELPKRSSQHSGWDVVSTGAVGPAAAVDASPAPPPYSAQGFNNPIGFPPIPGAGAPPPAAFVPPQFPGMMGMPPQGPLGGAFAGARPQPMYPMPSASPPPPPPPAFGQGMSAPFAPPPIPQPAHPARTKAPAFPWRPATVQRPQGVSVEAKTGEKDDDDESSEMDIDSPRVVEEKEVVVVEKEEVAGVEPAKGEGSPTAAEEADALDSLGEVSNQEEKGGDKGEEEDEFNWD
ncbi:hypothetical protein FOZ60_013407 [Perkinsus olseni]|uniref:Uncharacterized protein n=2 Tax=Perkinsus olseni TaxID=32597 RepID=A0A7J6PAR5_PEROL|nr:hypothetical protein FOZ60_013407 [Perkinsus olseni]